jgi:hypothetical protein
LFCSDQLLSIQEQHRFARAVEQGEFRYRAVLRDFGDLEKIGFKRFVQGDVSSRPNIDTQQGYNREWPNMRWVSNSQILKGREYVKHRSDLQ